MGESDCGVHGHDFRLGPCQWDRTGLGDCVAWDTLCIVCGGALMLSELDPENPLAPYDPERDWSLELEAKLHRLDDRDPLYPWDARRV